MNFKIFNNTFHHALIFFIVIATSITCSKSAVAESISKIPKGTVFTLTRELEIPANTRFVLLGKSGLQDFFSTMEQSLNHSEGRYFVTST